MKKGNKLFKRLLSFVAAIAMVLGMGFGSAIPAMAAATTLTDHAIVIDTTDSKQGDSHTYHEYQIFTGTLSTDGNTLSDVKWGSDITDTGKNALYTKYGLDDSTGKEKTAANVAKAIATAGAQGMAETLAGTSSAKTANLSGGSNLTAITGDGVTTKINGTDTTYTKGYYKDGLAVGYYLIVDETTLTSGSNDYVSNFIVELLDNTVAKPKGSVASVEKKVKDTNDSYATTNTANSEDYDTGDTQKWKTSADYDIGDTVPFQLTATLAGNVTDYTTYTFKFEDTLSKGLTYTADSWSLSFLGKTFNKDTLTDTVNGNTITVTAPTFATTSETGTVYEGGTTGTWTITITGASSGKIAAGSEGTAVNSSTAVLTYNATLNNNAVTGATGNPNKVVLEYSNDPNSNGTGKSTDGTVTVYTFQLNINKVDDNNKPLAGAKFKLQKAGTDGKYADYTNGAETEVAPVYEKTKDSSIDSTKTYYTESGNVYTKVDSPEESSLNDYYELTSYTVSFKGPDAGKYKIVETTPPDGYNAISDITFEVKAKDDKSVYVTDVSEGATITPSGESSASDAGIMSTTIQNKAGSVLPSTGGIGTTIFYVIGGCLVVAAAVILIARKRRRV